MGPESTPCCRRRPAAIGNPNKSARYRRFARFFELLPVRRELESSLYFASASFVLSCFTSTSPHAFNGSAQCGLRWFASLTFTSAPARSPWRASATPHEKCAAGRSGAIVTASYLTLEPKRTVPSLLMHRVPSHLCRIRWSTRLTRRVRRRVEPTVRCTGASSSLGRW